MSSRMTIVLLAFAGLALVYCGTRAYTFIRTNTASKQMEVYRSESLAAHQWATGQWRGQKPRGPVIIGDSIVAGLYGPALAPNTLVLGIGRDEISDVTLRIESYQFLQEASALVIAVGVNDLIGETDFDKAGRDYAELLATLPSDTPILVSPVLPVSRTAERTYKALSNAKIVKFNLLITELCQKHDRCRMVENLDNFGDNPAVEPGQFYETDGLHLSPAGYHEWTNALRRSTAKYVSQ